MSRRPALVHLSRPARLSEWLVSRPLTLLVALDAAAVAAAAAALGDLGDHDYLFLVALVFVALEGLAFDVRTAAPRVAIVLAASGLDVLTPGGMTLDELLLELPLTLVIGTIVALIISGRRSQLVRRYAGLYRVASNRLLLGQEFERRRVAHDLHEDVAQALAALALRLEALLGSIPPDEPVRAQVEDCLAAVRGAMDAVRALAERVRPTRLTENGLVIALQDLAARAMVPTSVEVDPGTGSLRDLEPEAVVGVFRIAEEAITNVVRHSGAGRAWIEVGAVADHLRVVIGDDGSGFDAIAALDEGLGLSAMQERAAMLRGSATISSAPGAGTTIEVLVPYAGRGPDHAP